MIKTDNRLAQLFFEHRGKTIDKWEQYLAIYARELAPFLEAGKPVRLLEIGVQNGGSLELWEKYLPVGSEITGVDIAPLVAGLVFTGAVTAHVADATDPRALIPALGERVFDIIIDDGSHHSRDVIAAFNVLYHRLADGGKFFIEDMHASYWRHLGGGMRDASSAVEFFKDIVDGLYADYFEADAPVTPAQVERLRRLNRSLARVSFYDSVIVVERLAMRKDAPYRRMISGVEAQVVDPFIGISSLPVPRIETMLFSEPQKHRVDAGLLDWFADAQAEITDLKNRLAVVAADAADAAPLRAALAARDEELVKLRAALAARERSVAGLKAEVIGNERRIAETQAELTRANDALKIQYGQINDQHGQIVGLHAELAALRASKSWRITAPLRSTIWYAQKTRAALSGGSGRARLLRVAMVLRRTPPGQAVWGILRKSERFRAMAEGLMPPAPPAPVAEVLTPRQLAAIWHLKELCDPYNQESVTASGDDAFKISVLTPTYNTNPRYLRELLQSLKNQQYPNWEWVVSDDGSSNPATISTLRELAAAEPRMRLVLNDVNQGISGATNTALAAAIGHYAALVDHDDLVARDAFVRIYQEWLAAPQTQLFYTDECKLLQDGTLADFWPKPDWSPAYLENTMCLGHLSVYEMEFLRSLRFRSEFDGTQDYDLALRASLKMPKVRHLPIFAYLWRAIPGSAATDLTEKWYAVERQQRAVEGYAHEKHPDATVAPGFVPGYWRINYPLPAEVPLLSYVIPTGGGTRVVRGETIDLITNCIRSFQQKAFYPNCEYIVVHNGDLSSEQIAALNAMADVLLVQYTSVAFNFSEKLNLGAASARGEYLCLLNDDVEALTAHGGAAMVSYLYANPHVGAIGPLCLREDDTIQQNGIVLLPSAGPAHAGDRQPIWFGGHQSMLRCRREAFAIGGAVLFTSKKMFDRLGGFSEDLPLNYNDVDFCVRLREQGFTCVVDPDVSVYHFEGATKNGTCTVEQEMFFLRHPGLTDPYFNKWFDPGNPNYVLNLEQAPVPHLGPWLDRHISRRAAVLKPQGNIKLSVCVSVYNQPKQLLEEMYTSVRMQTYPHKELVIVDNGSSNPETLAWLERVKREGFAACLRLEENAGIIGGNRALLDAMTGDFFVAMDSDDFLTVDALQIMAHAIEAHPEAAVFYSDEFKSDMNSSRYSPFFKPDFDPVLLMNCCYPAHLMAMRKTFLQSVNAYDDAAANWSHDYDTLTRALAAGETPVHVRELLYAWRINPGSTASVETGTKPGTVASQTFALERLLAAKGLANVLRLEPNTLGPNSGMWHVAASRPVESVQIVGADVWGAGVAGLLAAAGECEWLAVLLSPDDPHGLLELSALAWLEPRLAAVSGLLLAADETTLRWSGGLFLPGGRLLDPYFGKSFTQSGYHGQLYCQRCVDVAAPVNLLLRTDLLRNAAERLPADAGPDAVMAMLGLLAHEQNRLIAVTPLLRAKLPPNVPLPLDRAGLLLGNPTLEKGSRWYDGRLSSEEPYAISELHPRP